MSKSNQDTLFNRRELKRLLKQGYLYLTFDSSVIAWKKQPDFVPVGTYGMNEKEINNVNKGIWCSNSVIEFIKLSEISKISDPRVHIYGIEKLLQIVPNSEQKESK